MKAKRVEMTTMSLAEMCLEHRKAGREEEYKKWVKAFMKAGILIAEVDTVGVAIEETRRAGIREVVEWIENQSGFGIPYTLTAQSKRDWQAFKKEKGIE